MKKLDKLFDISFCKCKIELCPEKKCTCKDNVHIKCVCPKERKLPVLELRFLKSQRDKVGSIGQLQIGNPDIPVTKKQQEALERKEKDKICEEKRKVRIEEARRKEQSLQLAASEFLNNEEVLDETSPEAEHLEPPAMSEFLFSPKQQKSKHNTMDITNIALASLRHHTGLREAAEIATAALIDAKLITEEDHQLIIDHNKLKRAQDKLIKKMDEKFEETLQMEGLSCLIFDGRKDDTKVITDVDGKQFPGMSKEEHYAVCKEPGGEYLFHFVPQEQDHRKHAEIIADQIIKWVKDRNLEDGLQAIGGDSTNVNTGWSRGVMSWVEKKLDKRLVWIVCNLHTGELSLRHLIIEIDGPTLSNNKWSGPLGKMLDTATELEFNSEFIRITVGPPPIELSEDVIKDLSTDQSSAYQMIKVIRDGRDNQARVSSRNYVTRNYA